MGGAELLPGAASFLPALGVHLECQPATTVQSTCPLWAYLRSPFPSPFPGTKAELLQRQDDASLLAPPRYPVSPSLGNKKGCFGTKEATMWSMQV